MVVVVEMVRAISSASLIVMDMPEWFWCMAREWRFGIGRAGMGDIGRDDGLVDMAAMR